MPEFLSKNDFIAVVGVSTDPSKYGHKVFLDLLNKGYRVFAVHPDGGGINGNTRYASLSEIPEKVTLVSLVVPPDVALKAINEAQALGIKKVWFQPGSESDEALAFAKEQGMETVAKACIMIKS